MNNPTNPILACSGLYKSFTEAGTLVQVLNDINLTVAAGETIAIVGASGSGKSTFLHLLGGLDRADEGQVEFDGRDIYAGGSGGLNRYRCQSVGFVFQFYHLLPELTAGENVMIGAMVGRSMFGWPRARSAVRARAIELLDQMGLKQRLRHKPAKLSGGERQRVALGRALLTSPRLLLMDEPLASLDQGLKSRIIPYLRHIRTDLQIPILYVSHSVAEILELTGQVIVLRQGQVVAHGDFFRIATHPGVLSLIHI